MHTRMHAHARACNACTHTCVWMYRHAHACAHTCTHVLHPASCAGWTEKAAFQGMQSSRCSAVLGLYWGCTGAVPGLAGVEVTGWVAGAGRSQSLPGALPCIAAPEPGKLLEGEEEEGKRGAEGATPVFSSLAPRQEMR